MNKTTCRESYKFKMIKNLKNSNVQQIESTDKKHTIVRTHMCVIHSTLSSVSMSLFKHIMFAMVLVLVSAIGWLVAGDS